MRRKKLFFHFYPNHDQNRKQPFYFLSFQKTFGSLLRCWTSLLPEHVLFVQVHAQSVPHAPASYNCREHVPACYNCQEHVPACYNCREHVPATHNCREQVPACYNCREHIPASYNCLIITVENTFPLLITVGKNNGSSFFLKKRGTSEMSSMGHRNFLMSIQIFHFARES